MVMAMTIFLRPAVAMPTYFFAGPSSKERRCAYSELTLPRSETIFVESRTEAGASGQASS